jgi:hypothetical protein
MLLQYLLCCILMAGKPFSLLACFLSKLVKFNITFSMGLIKLWAHLFVSVGHKILPRNIHAEFLCGMSFGT